MAFLKRLWTTIAGRTEYDSRIGEEMEFHVEMRTEELMREGMDGVEARLQARKQFGALSLHREETRDSGVLLALETFARELRHAWRGLRRKPGLTLTALLSLMLGIGANTAIFSILDAVALRPLPIVEADRVYTIHSKRAGQNTSGNPRRMFDWKAQSKSFEAMAGLYWEGQVLTGMGDAQRIRVIRTFGDYFDVTGQRPAIGRLFTREESQGLGESVVIVSSELRDRLFSPGADVLGRNLTFETRPYRIIGVMPYAAGFPEKPEAWMPGPRDLQQGSRKASYLFVFARLAAGASGASVEAELNTIQSRLAAQYPDSDRGIGLWVEPIEQTELSLWRRPMWMVLGIVSVVLLLACLNITSLLLSRALERREEAAVRAALGAGRASLIRLYLMESLLLSVGGGALALMLSMFLVDMARKAVPFDVPRLDTATVDLRVAAFCLLLSLISGLVFGLAPAIQTSRLSLIPSLARATRSQRLRSLIVASEVAIAITLTVGAAMLVEAFVNIRKAPLGFDTEQLLTFQVTFPWTTPKPRLDNFYQQAITEFSAIPGVRDAALADALPLDGGTQSMPIHLAGIEIPHELEQRSVSIRGVSSGYFAVIGTKQISGDGRLDPGTVVVNETFVRQYLRGREPIGQIIRIGDTRTVRIAGVVKDIRQQVVVENHPAEIFLNIKEVYWPLGNFVLRTNGDPESFTPAVRAAVKRIDPLSIVSKVAPMRQVVNQAVAAPRLYAWFAVAFGVVGILLALIGIHGLLASDVAQRSREIGIRMALGADRRRVMTDILRRALILSVAGGLIGVFGAFLLTKLLAAFAVGVTPQSWIPYAAAAGILCAMGPVASYLPARRAAELLPNQLSR